MNLRAPIPNQLLSRFPQVVLDRWSHRFKHFFVESGQVLYEPHAEMEYSYFPKTCALSNVLLLSDGSVIEVATVGNEGGVGTHLSTPVRTSAHRVFAQLPGDCIALSSYLLEAEVEQNAILRNLLNAYHAAFLFQVSQSVACNGLHKLQRRCARWLLMSHDRAESDEFPLTHEYLANMLGVRRSTVTEALQVLQERGIIRCVRGRINIVDRVGLEATSCECYRMVQKEYKRLLGQKELVFSKISLG